MIRSAVPQTSPRRVLLVEHNIDGTVGGSHYCLLDICRNLDRSRFQPIVLFFQTNTLLDEFRSACTDVIVGSPVVPLVQAGTVSGAFTDAVVSMARVAVNAVRLLVVRPIQWVRFLRRNRIDLVHLNNSFNGDHDLILAASWSRIPCVAHQRGVPGTTGRSESWFGRRLAAIIAISGFIRDDLLRRHLPESRVVLISDGIDPDRAAIRRPQHELRRSLGISPDQSVVGVVGNIKPWKGQHVFIEAVAMVVARYPSLVGLIVGATADTAYQRRLTELVRQRGLDGNIAFVGYQRHPVDYMAIMDVVVHTSVEPEPFGLVIPEAMALEKPVIATAVGGPVDIVVDGVTGYLTCAGNPGELADRILRLLGDPSVAKRMGTAGRRRFLERFTASRCVHPRTGAIWQVSYAARRCSAAMNRSIRIITDVESDRARSGNARPTSCLSRSHMSSEVSSCAHSVRRVCRTATM